MCGSVEIRTVYVGSKQAKAAVISRYVYVRFQFHEKIICILCEMKRLVHKIFP